MPVQRLLRGPPAQGARPPTPAFPPAMFDTCAMQEVWWVGTGGILKAWSRSPVESGRGPRSERAPRADIMVQDLKPDDIGAEDGSLEPGAHAS